MTGGLLGAVNGPDWLGSVATKVQDYGHLRATASALLAPSDEAIKEEASLSAVRRFSRRLLESSVGDAVAIPDGRRSVIDRRYDLPTKTRHEITSFVLRTDDGQTLHITKRRRTNQSSAESDRGAVQRTIAVETAVRSEPRVVFAIDVSNVDESIRFYRDLVGLTIARQTAEVVRFRGGIALVPLKSGGELQGRQLGLRLDPTSGGQPKIVIFVTPPEFEALHSRMAKAAPWVSRVTSMRSSQRFSCIDPDGTLVEIRETNGTST